MKIKIGISKCLLGEACRYDGGHKRDEFITKSLSNYFEFIPFCPEEEILGTPRESIRLVQEDGGILVRGNKTKTDYTDRLKNISKEGVKRLIDSDIRGFIFKAKSPSCGFERVKMYNSEGVAVSYQEKGIFASELLSSFDYLPYEDEARLNDSWLRENFIMELFSYDSLKSFLNSSPNMGDLVNFHSKYKFLLMSKNQKKYYDIGKIIGNQEALEFEEILKRYEQMFISLLQEKSTKAKSMNTLQHIFGFLKKLISKEEKSEVLHIFNEFKDGLVPLIVPIKVLNLYVIKYDIEYLKNQVYLNPYPEELALRSDVKAFK